jgi:ferredoxin
VTNILNVILGNLKQGPETLRFPDRVVPAAKFRGSVAMDPEKCLACGICDHVCVSGAIELRAYEDHADWNYDPGRCTFCARCVDHCPVGALTQEADRPATYAIAGALSAHTEVQYPTCPECGSPALPFGEAVLGRAFSEISDEIRQRARLCDKCRRRAAQSTLKGVVRHVTDIGRNTDER